MRIANNIMAMNTHRAYTQNNDRVQTSAEKLSSGYRINRAGDDAAGLAISEKMRSQIRGLNMSTKNSQDAVSLIQTAEGALQEVHSMLQRMNELAVQSATGTNEGFDRTQIAKEFEQLKREINDISEQTTFNNMNILDGSLSAKGLQRTEYTSGVYKTFEAQDPTAPLGGINKVQNGSGTQYKLGATASFEVDLTGAEIKAAGEKLTLKIGDKEIASFGANAAADSAATVEGLQNRIKDEVTLSVGGQDVKFKVEANGTKGLKFTATDMSKDISEAAMKELEVNLSSSVTTNSKKLATSGIQVGTAEVKATSAVSQFDFDFEQTKSGDVLNIGKQTFVFYDSQKDDLTETQRQQFKESDFMLDLQEINTASTLAKAIGTAENKDGIFETTGAQANAAIADEAKISASASGNTITIKYAGTGALETADSNTPATGGIYGSKSSQYVAIDAGHINELPKSVSNSKVLGADTTGYTGEGKITKGAFTFTAPVAGKNAITGTATSAAITFDISSLVLKGEAANSLAKSTDLLEIKDATGKVLATIGNSALAAGATTADTKNAAAIAAVLDTTTKVNIYGTDFTVSFSSGNLQLKAKEDKDTTLTDAKLQALTISVNDTYVGKFNTAVTDKQATKATTTQGLETYAGQKASISFDVDTTKLQAGDKFTVGGKTFSIVSDSTVGNTYVDDSLQINIANKDGLAPDALNTAIMTAIGEALKDDKGLDSSKVDVDVATNKVTIATKDVATGATDDPFKGGKGFISTPTLNKSELKLDTVAANNPAGKGTTTFEIDTLKLKAGDMLSYTTTTGGVASTKTHTFKDGDTVATIIDKFGIDKSTVDGNSWKVEGKLDQSATLQFKAADDYKAGTYDTMKIQVGALEGEQLAIKIGAMNTAGLGLDDQKIYTQESAGKAVTATRDAINKVSDQRALLGAMQNRMTHKIANLKVSVENLQASESRIRDIDIASEMTTFTKNNILSQAATSMLAQANSAPQNVLSLLR